MVEVGGTFTRDFEFGGGRLGAEVVVGIFGTEGFFLGGRCGA